VLRSSLFSSAGDRKEAAPSLRALSDEAWGQDITAAFFFFSLHSEWNNLDEAARSLLRIFAYFSLMAHEKVENVLAVFLLFSFLSACKPR